MYTVVLQESGLLERINRLLKTIRKFSSGFLRSRTAGKLMQA